MLTGRLRGQQGAVDVVRVGRGGVVLTCLAVLGVVVGGVLVVTGLTRSPSSPAPPRPVHRAAAPAPASHRHARPPRVQDDRKRGVPDLTTGPVMPASTPVRLSIPRLRVTSALERLGVDASGAMQVPVDPAEAGWYDLGPAPGSLGPAVVAGHVTWNGSHAVFFALATLRPGDEVAVHRADGRTAVFAVHRVAQFQKTHFPTHAVFGPVHRAALRLITCGGTYDAAAHRYLANVVVFATLVSER